MAYMGVDGDKAEALARALSDAATAAGAVRRVVLQMLGLAGLASDAPFRLGEVEDRLGALDADVTRAATWAGEQRSAPGPLRAQHVLATVLPGVDGGTVTAVASPGGEDGAGGLDPAGGDVPVIEAVPGLSVVGAPGGWPRPPGPAPAGPALWFPDEQVYGIVGGGDSFGSGLGGNPDTYARIREGDTYEQVPGPGNGYTTHPLYGGIHPSYQSLAAPSLQAIHQLQIQYPGARIEVAMSSDPTETISFPPLYGDDGLTFRVKFVAAAGATTGSMLGIEPWTGYSSLLPPPLDIVTGQVGASPFQPVQIDAVTPDIRLVFTSHGGNDGSLFTGAIQHAITTIGDGGTADILDLAGQVPLHTASWANALTTIAGRMSPDGVIVDMGYPNPLPGAPPEFSWWRWGLSEDIRRGELDALNTLHGVINEQKQTAAEWAARLIGPAQSIIYVDNSNLFAGHELWTPDEATNRFVVPGWPASYHPNDLGQAIEGARLAGIALSVVDAHLGRPVPDPPDPFTTLTTGVLGEYVTDLPADEPAIDAGPGLAVTVPGADLDPLGGWQAAYPPAEADPAAMAAPELADDPAVAAPGIGISFDPTDTPSWAPGPDPDPFAVFAPYTVQEPTGAFPFDTGAQGGIQEELLWGEPTSWTDTSWTWDADTIEIYDYDQSATYSTESWTEW